MSARVCIGSLTVFLMVVMAFAVSQAKGLRDILEGGDTLESANAALLADLAAYYRMHAKVRLGREQRLANGVAWRLLTDVRTLASAPRLTWMPDRRALLAANALFEAAQGADLVDYDRRDLERRHTELYGWEDGHPPVWVIKPPYVIQEMITVTYATSRLVSYIDRAREVRSISMGLEIRGRVLDLERGRFRAIESCDGSEHVSGNFRFGELLDVCQDEAYARFMALWMDKVRQATTKARANGDDLSVFCADSMEPLVSERRSMSLYLTLTGVAIFNAEWFPRIARHCAFNDITVNPIILSYRELEPFMKPGPWRDDVLSQGSARSR